jgi:hypothetical protein
MDDKSLKKLFPLAILYSKRHKHIDIWALHTGTTLKLHRDHIPALITTLKNLHQELSGPLSNSSDRPSLVYFYDFAKNGLTPLAPGRRSSCSKQRSGK